MAAVTALAITGCGSAGTFANQPRPPTPVNLTVYINDSRVSLSPTRVGAGEVVFIVTNQARSAESLTIHPAGNSRALANTGPINPQSTAQVTVDFRPGEYTVATGSAGGAGSAGSAGRTEAARARARARATRSPIQPAALHIGPKRPSSSDALLQP
jgi:hypothetical protein